MDYVGFDIASVPDLFTDEPSDPTFERAFRNIRKQALRNAWVTLSDDDRKLSYLVRRMNSDSECWPSFETMHQDLSISISTLEDRVAKMCKRKLISVGKHTSNGKYRNNVYTLYSLENPEIYRDSDVLENEELPLFVA